VAMVVGFQDSYRRFSKIIKSWHKHQKWTTKSEKKWATVDSHKARMNFLKFLKDELNQNRELKLYAIVFNKLNKPENLITHEESGETRRGISHLIYGSAVAQMLSAILRDIDLDNFSYCPDDLNENVRTLEHILEYQTIFLNRQKTRLKRMEYVKAMDSGLNCADMVAGAVWENFERGNPIYFDEIKNSIEIIHLCPTVPTLIDDESSESGVA
ncbi:hypothetical protein, partial [Acinetobacter baumannii]|nr:hypothetical protein [Acinetobacter baumannii]